MRGGSNQFALGSLACLLLLAMSSQGWSYSWRTHSQPAPSWASESMTVLIVNQDQFAGSWKQFKGELKKEWGEFTDDDLLEIEGRMDKFEGKLQERYGDRKEELREWVDQWFERHTFESQSSKQ